MLGLVGVGRGPWRATGLLAALQGRLARGLMAVVVLGSDVGWSGSERDAAQPGQRSSNECAMATRRADGQVQSEAARGAGQPAGMAAQPHSHHWSQAT